MKYLAIDYGNKRAGLAVCDPSETIVSPLKVLNKPKYFVKQTADLIADQKIDAVVIGLPFNMDDSQGPAARAVLKFAEQLSKIITVPIYFQDERLSTFAAEEKLADIEMTKKRKKEHIDAVAAANILEAFLEKKKGV
jgi:putative Holliday junction resolvase